jgi:hypothetical protein
MGKDCRVNRLPNPQPPAGIGIKAVVTATDTVSPARNASGKLNCHAGRNRMLAFVPPKPKLLESAALTGLWRAARAHDQ